MKRILRLICAVTVFSQLLAVPAQAESTVEPRASAFFSSYCTDLYKTSATSFKVWFDVTANAGTSMQELGVSEIIVYRSADQQTWKKMRTYTVEDYPHMVEQGTTYHSGYVTYGYATPGNYYRAYITFYAKNSIGIGERYIYTEILHL